MPDRLDLTPTAGCDVGDRPDLRRPERGTTTMNSEDHLHCAWCGKDLGPATAASPETTDTRYVRVSLLPGPAPAHGSTWMLCPDHGAAVAHFIGSAEWRKQIDGAIALAYAHGYRMEP